MEKIEEYLKQHLSNLKKEDFLQQAYAFGLEYEQTRTGCSQCVVRALERVLGLNYPDLVKSSFPLCGGITNTVEGTCGGLTGGALVIGYLYGRNEEEFDKTMFNRKSLPLAKKLFNKFIQEYNSIRCKDIQTKIMGRSFNLWNEEEKRSFENAGGHKDKCPVVVAKACAWTAEIIWDEILVIK
jgi:C_GCAxxG_C_C family probable redox protein